MITSVNISDCGSENQQLANKQALSIQLNAQRLARAVSLLPGEQQHLLHLIPWLFQANHALSFDGLQMPLSDAPVGISGFKLTSRMLLAATALQLPPLADRALQYDEYALEGIYVMGSTGTLGQNPSSDIDVWLVYNANMSTNELNLLNKKAEQLTLWFEHYQLEVNFYTVHPHQFRADVNLDSKQGHLTKEHSGSTQQWLLLEEFYRTHMVLAGKKIICWHDPDCSSDAYQHNELLTQWLYLGDVQTPPVSEYFAASLWLLYKGLNTPHKALLKVLLLEVYANTYPSASLISNQIWQACLQNDFAPNNDSYLLLYRKIEHYLLGRNEHDRLEVVRCCFYLKCGLKLTATSNSHDWRRPLIQALVNEWRWEPALLARLDNCDYWHAGELQIFNAKLNELLVTSYRNLLVFSDEQGLSDDIRIEELGILARKLHTYFSDNVHQLSPLNKLWSRHVAEPSLVIKYRTQDRRYQLYRAENSSQALIKSDNVTAIVAWASLNGVATDATDWQQEYTQVSLANNSAEPQRHAFSRHRGEQLSQLSQRLSQYMGQPQSVSKLHLCQPWYYQRLILVANLDGDNSELWLGDSQHFEHIQQDIFSFGQGQRNLLSCLDVICLNSWGEWQSHRFEGRTGLLEAISFISLGLKRTPKELKPKIISCSRTLTHPLEAALTHLVARCLALYRQSTSTTSLMLPIMLGKQRFGLFFRPEGIVYKALEMDTDYCQRCDSGCLQALSCEEPIKLVAPAIGQINHASVPNAIGPYITRGAKQYFMQASAHVEQILTPSQIHKVTLSPKIEVFMLDEDNQLTQMSLVNQTMEQFVIQKSHAFAFEGKSSTASCFNMPQFFKLSANQESIDVVPFGSQNQEMSSDF